MKREINLIKDNFNPSEAKNIIRSIAYKEIQSKKLKKWQLSVGGDEENARLLDKVIYGLEAELKQTIEEVESKESELSSSSIEITLK
jgi:hypothetical protein